MEDDRWAPLLAKLSWIPEAQILLARMAPALARETFSKEDIWGLLTLDPSDTQALEKAEELFSAYEELSVVKPQVAARVARGALALALSQKPQQLERIRPFAKGDKLVGAVSRAHAAELTRLLAVEGIVIG